MEDRENFSRAGSNPVGSVAVYIIASTCVMFLIMSCVIVFISYRIYQQAFYDYSNDLCMSNNA